MGTGAWAPGGSHGGPRRVLWVVGAALLLLVLVVAALYGGYALGSARTQAGTGSPSRPGSPAMATKGVVRATSPQWPGARYLAVSGPRKGLPAGWPDTKLGAFEAASEIFVIANQSAGSQPGQYSSVYGGNPLTTYTGEVGRIVAPAGSALATQGGLVNEATPVAFHIDSWSGSAMKVEIWAQSIAGIPYRVPMSASWATTTFTVTWTHTDPSVLVAGEVQHDWTVTTASILSGPTPSIGPAPGAYGTPLPQQYLNWRRYTGVGQA